MKSEIPKSFESILPGLSDGVERPRVQTTSLYHVKKGVTIRTHPLCTYKSSMQSTRQARVMRAFTKTL